MSLGPKELAAAAFAKGKYKEALPLLRPFADQDDVDSLLCVAWINESGAAGLRDLEFAKRCYLRAADLGSCDALYRLGRILRKSNDIRGAIMAFERGAKQEYLPCMSALGLLLARTSDSPEQTEAAMVWLKNAADRGHYYARKGVILYKFNKTDSILQMIKSIFELFVISMECLFERFRNKYSLRVL